VAPLPSRGGALSRRILRGVTVRVTVVGAGVMGDMHARIVANSARAVLAQVVDVDVDRARTVTGRWGGTPAVDVGGCDAVIVAAPTHHHTEIALPLLRAGLPVLVEKPLAFSARDVNALLAGGILMCGFVERFNPVVCTLLDILDGPVVHLLTVRHSPPAPRIPGSVTSDLLIHDLDLASRLIPGAATVTGAATGDTVDCTLRYPTAIATLSASRAAQRKTRTLTAHTATSAYELDLLRQTITVYRHLAHDGDHAGYRADTAIGVPFVAGREPLAAQFDHFLDLAAGLADPELERASIRPAHDLAAQVERFTLPVAA
jgi:predicted dehydrogenase